MSDLKSQQNRTYLDEDKDRHGDQHNEFLRLAEAYADFVRKEGIAILPYRSPALTRFSALEPERKRGVLDELRVAVEVFEEMAAEGQRLTDSPKLLWRAMRRLELVPRADVFGKMTANDVVVLFTVDEKILFFNLRFLEFHTYTVEEVYCALWHRDSRRTSSVFGSRSSTSRRSCATAA